MNTETREAITAAVMAEVEKLKGYQLELVYVAYDDKLMDEQIDALVKGDFETLDESMDEWVSESRFHSTCEIIDELLKDLSDEWDEDALEDWRLTEDFDEVRFAIEERDTSEPIKALARNSGQVMLRITLKNEDDSYSYQALAADQVLNDLGLPETEANLKTTWEIIDNASPEFSVCMVSALASVDVSDLYDLLWTKDPAEVEITNPGIWLGNPFSGSGYADQLEGTILVKREDLRTDKGAFGYGWQDVAGSYASAFPVKIKEA